MCTVQPEVPVEVNSSNLTKCSSAGTSFRVVLNHNEMARLLTLLLGIWLVYETDVVLVSAGLHSSRGGLLALCRRWLRDAPKAQSVLSLASQEWLALYTVLEDDDTHVTSCHPPIDSLITNCVPSNVQHYRPKMQH
jgi:hypothetical protein